MGDQIRTLVRWPDGSLTTEEREAWGWVVLVEYVRCPAECENGSVWEGSSDLATCTTCDGGGNVPVGVGGAYVAQSVAVPVPEEPSLLDYENRLRYELPASASSGPVRGEAT